MKKKFLIIIGTIVLVLFIINPSSSEFQNYGKSKIGNSFQGGKINDFLICSIYQGKTTLKAHEDRYGNWYSPNNKKLRCFGIAGMFFELENNM